MILKYPANLLLFLFFPLFVFSQIDWRVSAETGFYNSYGDAVIKKSGLITRFDSFLKYKYEQGKREASVQFRFHPELFGTISPVKSAKLKADGAYYQNEGNLTWGMNVTGQRNFLNANTVNFTYNIFAAAVNFAWSDIGLNASTGYAYQIIKERDRYGLELLFLDLKLLQQFNSFIKYGAGFYVERFFASNEIILDEKNENNNNGWRTGPQISFIYLKDFILNVDYRILFHESEFTRYLSYEHWIRIVTGKIFFRDLSAFLLADYNFYRYVKSSDYVEAVTPLYTPLNSENKVYLKIAYELSDNVEVYTKTGYFKENLYEDRFSFEGWNFTFGIEFN